MTMNGYSSRLRLKHSFMEESSGSRPESKSLRSRSLTVKEWKLPKVSIGNPLLNSNSEL